MLIHTITIWDQDYARIKSMERNLQNAIKQMKIKARIQLNIEPPLIARNNLLGRTPVVQIDDGIFWRLEPGITISTQNFVILLEKLKIDHEI